MRISVEPDQVVAVLGTSIVFMYISYWAALDTEASPETLILLGLIKAGYLISSLVALNCLFLIRRINDGELPDLDSKADLRDLMICNGLAILVFWLSEFGLLAVSLKPVF